MQQHIAHENNCSCSSPPSYSASSASASPYQQHVNWSVAWKENSRVCIWVVELIRLEPWNISV